MSDCDEYLRRNLLHAASVGANANSKNLLERLDKLKRCTAWLRKSVVGIIDRTERVHPEMALWRDSSPDKPSYLK